MRPDEETIQRLPSRVAHSATMVVSGNSSPAAGSNLVNRMPSKRYKPVAVPNHKYPSVVCASAQIELGAPSRSVQDVWTNCVIAFCGSSAQTGRVQSQRKSHPQLFTIVMNELGMHQTTRFHCKRTRPRFPDTPSTSSYIAAALLRSRRRVLSGCKCCNTNSQTKESQAHFRLLLRTSMHAKNVNAGPFGDQGVGLVKPPRLYVLVDQPPSRATR
jgi:hypothetical protein